MKRAFFAIAMATLVSTAAHAGAWGSGSFENDDAMDWVATCTQSAGDKEVAAALRAASRSGYLEAPTASAAVAAAEVVAAAMGKPGKALPPDLAKWLAGQPGKPLAALAPAARQALARVKDVKQSELRQLWSEDGKPGPWLAEIANLEARLGK